MRVALFVHCFYPEHFFGTETYTLQLARQLHAMGHQVTVVTAIFAGEPVAADLICEYQYQEIPVIRIDKNHFPNLTVKETYYQPSFVETLLGLIQRMAPDIIHVTHLINHTAVLLEVADSQSIPVVATLTDFFGFCLNNKLEAVTGELCEGPNPSRTNCLACYLKDATAPHANRPLLHWVGDRRRAAVTAELLNVAAKMPPVKGSSVGRLVEDVKQRPELLRRLYKSYAAMITPTKFLQQAYRANGFEGPMDNMWFGVDLPDGPKPNRPEGAKLRIGFIGQIAEHKGTDLLIKAFVSLPPGQAELMIYGSLDQSPDFSKRLEEDAFGHAVRFMGTFSPAEMTSVLDGLDVLVIPSRWYENSPLVLLDALARHTPVVVANVPGLTEFVEHGVNGLHFERNSWSSLARQLERFVDGSINASEMSLRTKFPRTTRTMAEDVLVVYRRVLEGTAATRRESQANQIPIDYE